jgi:protein-S-isoprenylcysteine O-methyltransferase Ste14
MDTGIAQGRHLSINKAHCTAHLTRITAPQLTCWAHMSIELLLLCSTYPPLAALRPAAALLLPGGQRVEDRLFLSPAGLLGASLIGFSAALRSLCFRAMGANFTYSVTVVDGHRLTTTGPYAFVRHPAYAGSYCHYIGYFLYFSARGSWLRESGAYKVKLVWLVLIPLILRTFAAFRMFWRRLPVEDALMRKQFGKQWDEWAARVPYRLIPWVY